MAFPKSVKVAALAACNRHCCICHKFCGLKMELHHIKQEADDGENTFDNCIPLCFDCHADMGGVNPRHPKGNSYSEAELKLHRDNWYKHCAAESATGKKKTVPLTVKFDAERIAQALKHPESIKFVCDKNDRVHFSLVTPAHEILFESSKYEDITKCTAAATEFIEKYS